MKRRYITSLYYKHVSVNVCSIDYKIDFLIQCLFKRTFKTFKLKKKSSTLGINKTSESPPMLLRRTGDSQYDGHSLANTQLRHTVDIGLGSNFQRGAPNRSSMQDLSSRVSIFFTILNNTT